MVTLPPISFLDQVLDQLERRVQAPAWLVDEAQRRLVLLLNHVLQQEPQAQARLMRQSGKSVRLQWRQFVLQLQATPAGLLDLAVPGRPADLDVSVMALAPSQLIQAALRGDKPAVRIEGDVQLAAEINWLMDHVRWDIEEDLARILGDAPAHTLAGAVRRVADGLKQWAPVPAAGPAAG